MNFSDYKSEILKSVGSGQYDDFLRQDDNSKKDLKTDKYKYLGYGCTGHKYHVYLTLTSILPLFDEFDSAKSTLLEMFAYQRRFTKDTLKNEFATKRTAIQFLSLFSEGYEKGQAFIFRPEILRNIANLVQESFPSNTPNITVKALFNNSHSDTRQLLFTLTKIKIRTERDLIIQENWKQAKSALRSFKIITTIQLIWSNVAVRYDTYKLIKGLEFYHNNPCTVTLGDNACGIDLVQNRCLLDKLPSYG